MRFLRLIIPLVVLLAGCAGNRAISDFSARKYTTGVFANKPGEIVRVKTRGLTFLAKQTVSNSQKVEPTSIQPSVDTKFVSNTRKSDKTLEITKPVKVPGSITDIRPETVNLIDSTTKPAAKANLWKELVGDREESTGWRFFSVAMWLVFMTAIILVLVNAINELPTTKGYIVTIAFGIILLFFLFLLFRIFWIRTHPKLRHF